MTRWPATLLSQASPAWCKVLAYACRCIVPNLGSMSLHVAMTAHVNCSKFSCVTADMQGGQCTSTKQWLKVVQSNSQKHTFLHIYCGTVLYVCSRTRTQASVECSIGIYCGKTAQASMKCSSSGCAVHRPDGSLGGLLTIQGSLMAPRQ